MAAFQPTASQKEAIETRGSTVLVAAGAGSGKTRVLTERLMGYVTDPENPADLDRFLIITFTRAAAGELRSRIMDELAERLAAEPGNRRLRRQSALCQRAQIGTIHSFCAALLRENSHLAGLSPDFKIVDEERAGSMKNAALERVLERGYQEPEAHPGFLQLADTVGAGRDDRRLAELVLTLHEKMQSHARPERWAQEQIRLLQSPAADAGETVWGREILNWARESCRYWSGELDRLMEEMAACGKIAAAYGDCIGQLGDYVRELGRCLELGWERSRSCFPFVNPKLGTLRNSPDPALSDRVKARREACKKSMERIEKALASSSEKLLGELRQSAGAMEALLQLALAFDREYTAEKRRCALVDYGDLEHLTAALLTDEEDRPTELARQLSLRYTEIMVDEYQDVNRVQDSIFRAVSREGKNLFLVGDVKQSIYRFRLADPGIFTEKYESYADWFAAQAAEPRRILLQENFRSRREILEGANAVFSLCMSRRLGDLDYDTDAALKYGASYEGEGQKPELLLLSAGKGEEDESPDKLALEAALVAEKLKGLVEGGALVQDRGGLRPMEYGDAAILLRSVNRVGGVFRRALAQQGIPVATGQGGGFFSSVEVSTVMSMLALVDDPHQDIPLIAVLRSPAFGFSADELSAIRAISREGDFYTALCRKAEEDEKCARFLELLGRMRELAPDLSAAELVWQLLEELDMTAICSAMNDGMQRRARLMELVELAEQFEGSGYRGVHRFVQYLRKLEASGREPGLGADSGSAVQILSIHKSKGLEFPVVFLCDTARRFNKQDGKELVLVHPELGLGPKVTDLQRRIEYPGLARNAVRLRLERELLSEEMRLLYVAMTRARERLYLTAVFPDGEKKLEKASLALSRPMAPELLAEAGCFAEWLLYAALADGGEHLQLRLCQSPEEAAREPEKVSRSVPDAAAAERLRQSLAFRYPHQDAQELPSKITATELKGRGEADGDAQSLAPAARRPLRLPNFDREERPLSAAQRGTATHLVLQYMDFSRTGSLEAIRQEIARMAEAGCLTQREAQAVDAGAIERLFASPLGQRMRRAEKMQREFKFSLLCDAGEFLGRGAGEELLLQGVVDCFLEEEGELVIIDYKTDLVKNDAELQQRAALYTPQLQTYAAALSRICRKPVKECLLYFLALGKTAAIPGKKE